MYLSPTWESPAVPGRGPGASRLGSSEAFILALQTAVSSLCPHRVLPLCLCVSYLLFLQEHPDDLITWITSVKTWSANTVAFWSAGGLDFNIWSLGGQSPSYLLRLELISILGNLISVHSESPFLSPFPCLRSWISSYSYVLYGLHLCSTQFHGNLSVVRLGIGSEWSWPGSPLRASATHKTTILQSPSISLEST